MNPCPICKSKQIQLCTDSNNQLKDVCKCRECGCTAPKIAWEIPRADLKMLDAYEPMAKEPT